MPRAAGAQPAGYQADLRGPGCSVEDEAPPGPARDAGLCSCTRRRGPGTGLGGSVTRSHATSRQRRVRPNSQRPRPGEAGGGPGQRPPEHLLWGPFTSYGSSWKEDPPRARAHVLCQGRCPSGTTSQDTGDPEGHPAWERAPPSGQECEQQGQRGDPCSSRPYRGFQSPGSRQDRQPWVRAKTVPSTRGRGQLPRSQGTFLREVPGAEGTGRSGGGRAPSMSSPTRVTPGAAGSRRAESRAEQRGGAPPALGRHHAPAQASERRPAGRGQTSSDPAAAGAGPPSSALRRGSHAGRPDSSMYKRPTQDRPPRAD